MASHHPARCKVCGAHKTDTRISKSGYCQRHGEQAMLDAYRQMREREGPAAEAWARGLLRAAGTIGRPTTPYPPDA